MRKQGNLNPPTSQCPVHVGGFELGCWGFQIKAWQSQPPAPQPVSLVRSRRYGCWGITASGPCNTSRVTSNCKVVLTYLSTAYWLGFRRSYKISASVPLPALPRSGRGFRQAPWSHQKPFFDNLSWSRSSKGLADAERPLGPTEVKSRDWNNRAGLLRF